MATDLFTDFHHGLLRQLVDEIFVYHHEGHTFHPKIYVLLEPNVRAVVLLGSGNLTGGGLFTNYEGHLRIELDLTQKSDQALLGNLLTFCDYACDPKSKCAVPLTDKTFKILESRLLDETAALDSDGAEDEAMVSESGAETSKDAAANAGLFGSIVTKPAPPPEISYPRARRREPALARLTPAEAGLGAILGNQTGQPLARAAGLGVPVLLAEIPRASNRWNQANFNKQDFTGFFGAERSRRLTLWNIQDDGSVAQQPEVRPGVSVKSRNFRIELGAAAGRAYPQTGRPIGAFVRTAPREFGYMLLMPGTDHHRRVEEIVAKYSTSPRNRARRVRMPLETIRKEWPSSPLWQFTTAHPSKGTT